MKQLEEPPRPQEKVEAPPRYRLLKVLGRGGFGVAILAEDTQLGRPVVIKVLLEAATPAERGKVHREALITARLEHPGIPPVYEGGATPCAWSADPWKIPAGSLFFVMKWVRGGDLSKLLQEQNFWQQSVTQILYLFLRICAVIRFAHTHGLVHRDLKPANILLEDDQMFVGDWGIAWVPGLADVADPGCIVGTPEYMALEQLRGEEVDHRADVYALGGVLQELLTGHPPFSFPSGTDMRAKCVHILQNVPTPPRTHCANLNPDLEAIILKATARDRDARYATVAELETDIQKFLSGALAQEHASDHVRLAQGALIRLESLRAQQNDTQTHHASLKKRILSYASKEAKQPLWELEALLARLEEEIASSSADYVQLLHAALAACPTHQKARELLATYHKDTWLAAETQGDASGAALHEKLCKEFDTADKWEALHRQEGRLTLDFLNTPPIPVMEVTLHNLSLQHKGFVRTFHSRNHVLRGEALELTLPTGTYVLVLPEGHSYPVYIPRGHHWKGKIDLNEPGHVHPGFVLVLGSPMWDPSEQRVEDTPGQPWRDVPTFAIQKFPVTNREYCMFLNGLIQEGKPWEEALKRLPKWGTKVPRWCTWRPVPWLRQGRVELPQGLNPDLPVVGLSWHDAEAYAAWLSRTTPGETFRPPNYREWVKATCGIAGWKFAWSDYAEPTYGNASDAVPPGQSKLLPVHGGPKEDESVYGVHYTVGLMHWLAEKVDGQPDHDIVVGGCYLENMSLCSPRRWRVGPKAAKGDAAGFRLVQVL